MAGRQTPHPPIHLIALHCLLGPPSSFYHLRASSSCSHSASVEDSSCQESWVGGECQLEYCFVSIFLLFTLFSSQYISDAVEFYYVNL